MDKLEWYEIDYHDHVALGPRAWSDGTWDGGPVCFETEPDNDNFYLKVFRLPNQRGKWFGTAYPVGIRGMQLQSADIDEAKRELAYMLLTEFRKHWTPVEGQEKEHSNDLEILEEYIASPFVSLIESSTNKTETIAQILKNEKDILYRKFLWKFLARKFRDELGSSVIDNLEIFI